MKSMVPQRAEFSHAPSRSIRTTAVLLHYHNMPGGSAVCNCTTEQLGRMQLRGGPSRRVVVM